MVQISSDGFLPLLIWTSYFRLGHVLVRVMVGGLLGPLPPPAHPQQRHQAAQPRGQQQPARGFGEQHDVGSSDRGHGEVGEGPTSPWVSVM
jgi:hypothetical protein